MWKTVLAGTAALAIAGGSLVYAQQGPGGRGDGWRPSAEDISAFSDARIAGLKAGLRLNADQEKLWAPFEKALRDRAKQRADRLAAMASAGDRPTDPIERLQRRADAVTQMGTSMKAIADSAGPLYKSLDDAQKKRFTILARLEGRGHMRGHHGMHRHHGDMQHDGRMHGDGQGGGMMRRGPRGMEGGERL